MQGKEKGLDILGLLSIDTKLNLVKETFYYYCYYVMLFYS